MDHEEIAKRIDELGKGYSDPGAFSHILLIWADSYEDVGEYEIAYGLRTIQKLGLLPHRIRFAPPDNRSYVWFSTPHKEGYSWDVWNVLPTTTFYLYCAKLIKAQFDARVLSTVLVETAKVFYEMPETVWQRDLENENRK